MRAHHESIEVKTHGRGFTDVTSQLSRVVAASGIENGICNVFIQHTSASLLIQENADPAVLRDLQRWLSELAPESRPWEHDDEGPDDMPAHARSAVTRSNEAVPVVGGRLALGTWQAVYVWEHRARAHSRRLVVHVMGS